VIRLFRAFVREFPLARTPQKKMLAIDRLIHGFHVFYRKTSHDEDPRGEPTRPVAVNLIEGSLDDVVAFLDQLTYGDESTPGTRENYYQWTDKVEVHRDWYRFRQKGKARSGNEPDRK